MAICHVLAHAQGVKTPFTGMVYPCPKTKGMNVWKRKN
jgi:hypothetical protein